VDGVERLERKAALERGGIIGGGGVMFMLSLGDGV
jgi:hypothetical protein